MIRLLSHITLSLLLLLSATGMTINMHYCHDQLIDMALIAPAESCCESGLNECNTNFGEGIGRSNHCDNETLGLESTSDYVVSTYSFSFEDAFSFDLFYTTALINDGQSTRESSITTLFNFKKPPIPQDVVLSQIQSFLI